MTILLYPVYVIATILFTVIAILFSPIIALFVDSSGNLPRSLRWFQTPDNPCWGDAGWALKHPSYSRYWLCVTWLIRNPGQGFDQVLSVRTIPYAQIKIHGDIYINDQYPVKGGWFLLAGGGVFQFAAIIPVKGGTIDIGLGWRLDPIMKHYDTTTLGALIFTPFRYHKGVCRDL